MPNTKELSQYSEIRLVQVTGVHLTAFESYELMRRGAEPWPEPIGELEYIYPISSTPSFKVHALVDRTIKGSEASTVRFSLGGCGVTPPHLKERGIVFVQAGSGSAIAVWESLGDRFVEIEESLGIEHAADEP